MAGPAGTLAVTILISWKARTSERTFGSSVLRTLSGVRGPFAGTIPTSIECSLSEKFTFFPEVFSAHPSGCGRE